MKKLLFLLVSITFLINPLEAQTKSHPLAIKDILPLVNMTFDDFDSNVTDKGFKFDKAINVEEHIKRQYKWTGNYKTAPEIIIYGTDTKAKTFITYNTMDEEKYTVLKKEIKSLGFKVTSQSTTSTDLLWFTYQNGKYEISVTLFNDPEKYKYAFILKRI